jgi:hypothetical protein
LHTTVAPQSIQLHPCSSFQQVPVDAGVVVGAASPSPPASAAEGTTLAALSCSLSEPGVPPQAAAVSGKRSANPIRMRKRRASKFTVTSGAPYSFIRREKTVH